jgi:hypothetical protein
MPIARSLDSLTGTAEKHGGMIKSGPTEQARITAETKTNRTNIMLPSFLVLFFSFEGKN